MSQSSTPPPEQTTLTFNEAMQLAVQLQQKGRFNEAEGIYRAVLQFAPEHPDALHFLGLIAHQLGRTTEAIGFLQRAIAAAPDYVDAHSNLGNILKQAGRPDDAIAALRQAIALAPDRPDAYNNLATVLREQGDLHGAEAALEKAVALDPNHAEAHYNLGNLRSKRGNLEQAIASYQAAIARRPETPLFHHNLGLALAQAERFEEATAAFQKTIELETHHADAHFELAHCRAQAGAVADAVEGLRRSLEYNPKAPRVYQYLGNLLNLYGRTAEAAAVWRQWLEFEPDNPIPRHLLAAATGEAVPARAADDYVRQTFDSFATSFDQKLKELEYHAPELLVDAVQREVGPPTGSLDVLDAGCGTGWCGPLLRAHARRLVGVDLSPGMIAKARERGTYDELHPGELTDFMASAPGRFDLIVSADTLVYFGDLHAAVTAASRALRHRGVLAFTVEQLEEQAPEPDFRLHTKGRYAHKEEYVRRVLIEAGLSPAQLTVAELRKEALQPVPGLVVVARRAAGPNEAPPGSPPPATPARPPR